MGGGGTCWRFHSRTLLLQNLNSLKFPHLGEKGMVGLGASYSPVVHAEYPILLETILVIQKLWNFRDVLFVVCLVSHTAKMLHAKYQS